MKKMFFNISAEMEFCKMDACRSNDFSTLASSPSTAPHSSLSLKASALPTT
jgi:hypothetical protein